MPRPRVEGGTPAQIKAREYERHRAERQREVRLSPEYKAKVAAAVAAAVAEKESNKSSLWDQHVAVVNREEEARATRKRVVVQVPTAGWPKDSIISPPSLARLMGGR